MVQAAVPEIQEMTIGEAVNARTAALPGFHALGPPDLVHLTKVHARTNVQEAGTYHYVTGIDTSSASIAAYLNTLTYSYAPGEGQIWFGKHQNWKIQTGVYCCYNALSRVDLRVRVHIPGSVEAFVIDERGEKHKANEQIMLETYVCSVIRGILFADDEDYNITAYRRFNPIATREAEEKFVDAFSKLVTKGWQLGSQLEVQVPTLLSNNLITTFFKYLDMTGRYTEGVNLLEKLRSKEPDFAALLARVFLDMDEEVKAVQLLHDSIKIAPRDPNLLDVQSRFCMSKNRLDYALATAKRAVSSAPSEFGPWARLVKVYIEQRDFQSALLTLNSCPMFPYHNTDLHRMPVAHRVHLPFATEGVLPKIMDDLPGEKESLSVDPELARLPAASLRGTFAKAYELLVEISHDIGWDMLLKYRAKVFIMEEEYRTIKSDNAGKQKKNHSRADSDASRTAVNGFAASQPGSVADDGESQDETVASPEPDVVKPEQSVDAELVKGSEEHHGSSAISEPTDMSTPFKSKRLCERWLDNLFMVMYEDMRVYTLWRAESGHFKSQQLPYSKSLREWEILGALANRLKHTEEASEAFTEALNVRISSKSLKGLLDIYTEKGEPINILNTAVQLTSYEHRWYKEFSPSLIIAIKKLVQKEGSQKLRNMIHGSDYPASVIDLMDDYFELARQFRWLGYEDDDDAK
ncbi:Chs5p-Arf1p-binding proteins-domain-containing protein [Lipomyces arxii]|uniref:Chs5p-Arf1p-binding proteins-domain-containing protein n=1 Tax=Lipomyces arxii TaxID=56418 RepID=UPI0034CFFDAA